MHLQHQLEREDGLAKVRRANAKEKEQMRREMQRQHQEEMREVE
jgi:hypothetical protein